VDLRTKLNTILDDEIQALTRQDLTEATQIAHDMKARTTTLVLLLLLGGLACGTLTAVAITRAITGPVSQLVTVSRAMARGDLYQKANIRSKDEFGILGESFNEMIVQRQRAHTDLEARVQERTSALELSNERFEASNTQLIAEINERQRLEEVESLRSQEMAVADEVARIVTSTLNIDEVYERFAQELKKLVAFDRLHIDAIDQDAGTIEARFIYGSELPDLKVGTKRILEHTDARTVVATGQTLIRADIDADLFPRDLLYLKEGLHSRILVPLVSKGQIISIMGLRSREVGTYGPREQAILERLASQIAPALENVRLYEEQVHAEQELRASEERLRTLMENMPDGVSLSVRGEVVYTNPALAVMLGYESAEYQGQSLLTWMHPEDQERAAGSIQQILHGDAGSPQEYRLYSKDGSIVPVEVSSRLIEYGGEPALLSVLRDLTERKRLEDQLSHAQKMETVGRLAGGVAHDFNNLLTAIMGYSEMSLRETPLESPVSSYIQEVKKATERARNLTSQLLAFSRHQVIEPKVIDLNDLIINLDKMLRRLIGEDIELVTLPGADLEMLKVDVGQIEQVLMNLAVNARDAMPKGGKLTIETTNVTLEAEYVRLQADASPGPHVMLVVSDTGLGMSKEVQDHIFEPGCTSGGSY